MTFFRPRNKENIFILFIRMLGVKYTREFAEKLYEEHPYKNTLFGISRMLTEYGIENRGLRINEKDDIHLLPTPFIAHVGKRFGLVYKMTKDHIWYVSQGIELKNEIEEFKNIWDGIVLVAETTPASIEPDYKEHRKKSSFNRFQKLLLGIFMVVLLLAGMYLNQQSLSAGTLVSLLLNLTGVYISWLLVLKQLHIHSEHADKICSLFEKSDCNNMLESPAAKFMGIIGWSEVGLGYFIGNGSILVFFPVAIPWLACINILTLPYTFWSVWYQKYKVNTWCPLCLIVQFLLWAVFIVNLLFGYVSVPEFSLPVLAVVSCMYAIPFLAVSLLIPELGNEKRTRKITQEMGSLKMKNEVFSVLLSKEPYYETNPTNSCILLGNTKTPLLITVFSNPHCNPCAYMHPRIEKLLERGSDKICVQYIFSSFSKELDESNKFLIAVYLEYYDQPEQMKDIYNGWFTEGKKNAESYFKKYPVDRTSKQVLEEFNKHLAWKEATTLRATPTLLINGYKLPDMYKIEDILYFTDLVTEKQ